MRARPARRHALFLGCLLSGQAVIADGPAPGPAGSSKAAPAKAPTPTPAPTAASTVIAPASPAEVARDRAATEARIKALEAPEARDKPATRPLLDLLQERRRLLAEWARVAGERSAAEHPEHGPEAQAAESKADLEKTLALIEQAARAPDSLLPEVFQPPAAGVVPSDARLAEMKEAIDAARVEWKDRTAEVEKLRAEGTRALSTQLAALRSERDKVHQGFATLSARRGEREAALGSAGSAEARDLARERLANFDWEARVESERLAALEARIALAARRLDLGAFQVQARDARARLARRLAERMEEKYAALADRRRVDLKRAVVSEVDRAARADDPIEKYRAKHNADLLDLQEQVVAYEKASATTGGVSVEDQRALADSADTDLADLKKLLADGNVSPLDVLRLKNDFRRITPERSQVVRTDLAASEAETTAYEVALTDAEIDLVNDSRDDRFDRESLLEQVPNRRRGEARAVLDDLEARHLALLHRRRNVLQKLARRAEDAHNQVLRRIETLDQQYAFIRTHIFWIRDAEPLGSATFSHARDDSIRAAKALFRLACEAGDRSLWGRTSPEFVVGMVGLVLLPWPLCLARKALDRGRVADIPAATAGPINLPSRGSAVDATMGDE